MAYDFLTGVVVGAVGFSLLFVFITWLLVKHLANRLFGKWAQERLKREVAKSLDMQRPIIKGKISEQLFPILYKKFGNLSDFRFLGNPVDYISFDGLSEAREGIDKKVNVRFIEIKTGDASLSKSEELVKDAIKHGRVSWEEEFLE